VLCHATQLIAHLSTQHDTIVISFFHQTNTEQYIIYYSSLSVCLLLPFFSLLHCYLSSFSPTPMDFSSTSISHFRVSANSFLSQYEPLALLLVPLLSLFLAHSLRSFLRLLSENGLKATLLGFIMNAVKYNTTPCNAISHELTLILIFTHIIHVNYSFLCAFN